jgi:hypothetical protein
VNRPAIDHEFRVEQAREALAAHDAWDADDGIDGWGEVMGKLVGALEVLLPLVGRDAQ